MYYRTCTCIQRVPPELEATRCWEIRSSGESAVCWTERELQGCRVSLTRNSKVPSSLTIESIDMLQLSSPLLGLVKDNWSLRDNRQNERDTGAHKYTHTNACTHTHTHIHSLYQLKKSSCSDFCTVVFVYAFQKKQQAATFPSLQAFGSFKSILITIFS